MNIFSEGMDILLVPTVSAQYLDYSRKMAALGLEFNHSDCIEYFEGDAIAARTYQGTFTMFNYFSVFQNSVWFLTFLSITTLSLISSIDYKLGLNNRLLKQYFFNYSTLLLSKPIEKTLSKRTSKMVLFVLLFSNFVLSVQFSTRLMDYLIRGVPIIRIDTLEQLSQNKDMKIVIRSDDSLTAYILQKGTPLAEALSRQLMPYKDYSDIRPQLTEGLRNGSLVTINKRLAQIFNVLDLSEGEAIQRGVQKLVEVIHISEQSGVFEPYFTFVKTEWVLKPFNRM